MANSYGDKTSDTVAVEIWTNRAGSAVAPTSIVVKALAANSAAVYLGTDSSVTTSTGLQLNAGEAVSFDLWGLDALYVISAAAQHVRYLINHA